MIQNRAQTSYFIFLSFSSPSVSLPGFFRATGGADGERDSDFGAFSAASAKPGRGVHTGRPAGEHLETGEPLPEPQRLAAEAGDPHQGTTTLKTEQGFSPSNCYRTQHYNIVTTHDHAIPLKPHFESSSNEAAKLFTAVLTLDLRSESKNPQTKSSKSHTKQCGTLYKLRKPCVNFALLGIIKLQAIKADVVQHNRKNSLPLPPVRGSVLGLDVLVPTLPCTMNLGVLLLD